MFSYTPPPASQTPDLTAYAKKTDVMNNFVTPDIITTAKLYSDYPPGPDYRGKYCRVSDMWGVVDGVYRCTYNGRIYYWEPTNQTQYLGSLTPTANVTIQPLKSTPIIELLGAGPLALTTWTVTLGTENISPGLIKEIRPSFSNLLGILNLTGVGLASVVSMALGMPKRFGSYDNGSAVVWRQIN